jgi:hypothetical protein
VAGRHELGDLVADRLADAGDLGRVAGTVGGDQVDGAAPDRVGRPVVGDRLERDLALDLEDVADLVEDPGEVAVGQLLAAVLAGVISVVVDVVNASRSSAISADGSRLGPRVGVIDGTPDVNRWVRWVGGVTARRGAG